MLRLYTLAPPLKTDSEPKSEIPHLEHFHLDLPVRLRVNHSQGANLIQVAVAKVSHTQTS